MPIGDAYAIYELVQAADRKMTQLWSFTCRSVTEKVDSHTRNMNRDMVCIFSAAHLILMLNEYVSTWMSQHQAFRPWKCSYLNDLYIIYLQTVTHFYVIAQIGIECAKKLK